MKNSTVDFSVLNIRGFKKFCKEVLKQSGKTGITHYFCQIVERFEPNPQARKMNCLSLHGMAFVNININHSGWCGVALEKDKFNIIF